jgi:hypothetical protein
MRERKRKKEKEREKVLQYLSFFLAMYMEYFKADYTGNMEHDICYILFFIPINCIFFLLILSSNVCVCLSVCLSICARACSAKRKEVQTRINLFLFKM